jgi:polar amino acid transport system substrate-binding protein
MVCFLTDALPERIFAEQPVAAAPAATDRENVTVVLGMSDGSTGVIHYTATGAPSMPKEYVEVFGARRCAILDDYRRLTLYDGNRRRRRRLLNQAKGHAQEVAAFVDAVQTGTPMPIEFATLVAVTQTTLLIHRSLDSGQPVPYGPPRTGRGDGANPTGD